MVFGISGACAGWSMASISGNIERRKGGIDAIEAAAGNIPAIKSKAAAMAAVAAVWVLSAIKSEDVFTAFIVSLLFTAALIISLIDLHIRIIPNELVLALALFGAMFQLTRYGIRAAVAAAVSVAVVILLLVAAAGILGFEKIGAGDIKLIGAMGMALGYPGIVTALMVMGVSMLIYCIAGFLSRKLTLKSMFPFAPFIMLGMSCSLFYMIQSS